MAAHEEAGALCGNAFDGFPGLHVDDTDFGIFDVGGGQYCGVFVGPGDA